LALVAWLVAIASGPEAYNQSLTVFGAAWFKLLMAGWAFSGFYHLGNGIRHLAWDVGWGFELPQAYASGWAVTGFSFVATAVFLVLAFA
jgi:succinate dehydrogenase / fumarate reductase cytochrome b subunit